MRIIKIIFFTLISIIALIFIIGLFLPKTFHAGSSVVIDKPVGEVYDFVRILRNQPQYDAWSRKDEKIQQNFEGFDGKVGSSYIWKSDVVGNGKQVLAKLEPNKKVEIDIYFFDDSEPNKTVFLLDEIGPNQTKVTWQIDGKTGYPMNILTYCFDMNKDFEEGVQNLKQVLEKQ